MNSLYAVFLTLTVSALGLAQIPVAAGGEPAFRVRIPATNPAGLHQVLEARSYDAGCFGCGQGSVELVVSERERRQLEAAGLLVNVVETAGPLRQKLGVPPNAGTHFGNGVPTGYHDHAAINAFMTAMETAYPTLAKVVDLTATYGPGATFEGRAINGIKISDNATADEDEPEVLFVGCHHCREVVTPEICLDIINRLLTGYGSDPTITALVNDNEIWIAPVWNPDGLEYVWNTNNLWRKNRKPVGSGEFGVDLNRNYDLNWQALCGASNNPSSNTYSGPAPESEEETQTMVGFARARRFAKVMDFHSFGQEILQTYNCAPLPAGLEGWIDNEAVVLANTIGWNTRDPSADGEHYQWELKEITSYSFLAETHTTFQPPHASALAEAATAWTLNLAFLQKSIPVMGHVTDAATGNPVAAQVTVAGLNFMNGETRFAESAFGRYHLFLPDGTHQLLFDAPGYLQATATVTVVANTTTTQDVAMTQGGPFTLAFTTTGNGVGDVSLDLFNIPIGTAVGLTVFSLQTTQPVGSGNIYGIAPDTLTLTSPLSPPAATNPLHWLAPWVPGIYPLGTFVGAPGTVQFPAGTEVDGMGVAFTPLYAQLLATTPVIRVTF